MQGNKTQNIICKLKRDKEQTILCKEYFARDRR